MRFTIERLRTVVLVAGGLLIVALGVFLALGRWKNPFKHIDIPKKLGIEIQQEANGVTYSHTFGSHSVFKIHASKVVQLKNNHALLHDVKIELYEPDGGRVDRIEGAEFEYDQQAEIAKAAGPVEITMMRPAGVGMLPAGVGKRANGESGHAGIGKAAPGLTKAAAAADAAANEIHVKTSGLSFFQKTGVATTDQRVDFAVTQGTGSSVGATYDSEGGHLVLDHQVVLNVKRNGEAVEIHAQHGEFERSDLNCDLLWATAGYRGGEANAGEAKILFREDGTAVRMDATNGFKLTTAKGGRLAAPKGWLEFNEKNQPKRGHLEGGVTMDSDTTTDKGSRESHGSAPTADLEFTAAGDLRHAHLERGVDLASKEQSAGQAGSGAGSLVADRDWRSPVADIEFRKAGGSESQVEPVWLHGVGGVVITGETRRGNGAAVPSRLAADDMKINFGPKSTMRDLTGVGHASIQQTSNAGAHQVGTGDKLDVRFAAPAVGYPVGSQASNQAGSSAKKKTADAGRGDAARGGAAQGGAVQSGSAQIETATLDGHVIVDQTPAAKPGEAAGAPMHATAGRADYEGAGEWVHLTQSPRVDDGGLQLTADKIDVSQASGDAFAHGDVKATWFEIANGPAAKAGQSRVVAQGTAAQNAQGGAALGGHGPSHVIAAEAQMHKATGEATFRGDARLWQESNSVAAPVIVLNRLKQTLDATSGDRDHPVRVVLLSAAGGAHGAGPGKTASKEDESAPKNRSNLEDRPGGTSKPHGQSVIRMSGGELKYSDAERKAVMVSGAVGSVVADTPTARTVSDQVELILLPPGSRAGSDGDTAQAGAARGGSAQVDKMTANGHVTVNSQDRRGTGTRLVYTGESGDYVLTGTAGAPPKMTDPVRGDVTGDALIFHSRDDSVSIEGGGGKTVTETRTPK